MEGHRCSAQGCGCSTRVWVKGLRNLLISPCPGACRQNPQFVKGKLWPLGLPWENTRLKHYQLSQEIRSESTDISQNPQKKNYPTTCQHRSNNRNYLSKEMAKPKGLNRRNCFSIKTSAVSRPYIKRFCGCTSSPHYSDWCGLLQSEQGGTLRCLTPKPPLDVGKLINRTVNLPERG